MSNMVTRVNIPQLLRPGLYLAFFDYNLYPDQYKQIYQTVTSEKAQEYVTEMYGPSLGAQVEDGSTSNLPTGSYGQFATTVYTHNYYRMIMRVSQAAIEDNLYVSSIPNQAKMMRDSLQVLKNMNAMYQFNNSTNANSTMADGLPFLATNRPTNNGGTYNNTWNIGVALSVSAVEDAETQVKSFINAGSLILDTSIKYLLVPQALKFMAKRILKSAYDPGSSSNSINPVFGDEVVRSGVLVNNFLRNPYAYFFISSIGAQESFKLFQRNPISITRMPETEAMVTSVLIQERYSMGNHNPRGVFGSTGAANPTYY